jgi:hypothetical protein
MSNQLVGLAARREALSALPLPEEEVTAVAALLEELDCGLAAMPEVSAIDPAVHFAVSSAQANEGE